MQVVIMAVIAGWVLLSAVTSAACAVILRGGLLEDVRRGYLADNL